MKNAYSNIMGSYLDAGEVQHEDTAAFQIVCPCCAESVFKVARPLPRGEVSQFFSHRQAPEGGVAECERRVSGLTAGEIRARNEAGRAQSLRAFLSVIRDAIDLDTDNKGGASAQVWHRTMKSYKGMDTFQSFLLISQRHPSMAGWPEKQCEMFKKMVSSSNMEFSSNLGVEVQKRAAQDVMRHMLTREGGRNHGHLMRHAMGRLTAGRYTAEGQQVWGRDVLKAVIEATNTRTQGEAFRNLEKLHNQRGVGGTSAYTLARDLISAEMMGTLLRIPYREMLTNHAGGRPLLEGIDQDPKVERPGLGMAFRH